MAKGKPAKAKHGKPTSRKAAPEINYSSQAALGVAGPPPEDLPEYLFAIASETARKWRKRGKFDGVLMVVGEFTGKKGCRAAGMRQLGANPLTGRSLQSDSPEFAAMLENAEDAFGDGAVVINSDGQVLGAGAYVVVNHPEAAIPDEGGSRHLAAASASLRPDIVAAVTISEETGRVRLFMDGEEKALFDPAKQG